MELSSAEIQKLFTFVRSKYVRHVDVQHELVDHLASSIEEIRSHDPKITFDQALRQTYSKFPITGFTNYIAEATTAMNKYWTRRTGSYFLKFFTFPKIILTICLVSIFYFILTNVNSMGYVIIPTVVVVIFASLISAYNKLTFTKKYKELLFVQSYIGSAGGIVSNYLLIPTYVDILFKVLDSNVLKIYAEWQLLFLAIYMSIGIIALYCSHYVFPQFLKEDLEAKYNHLKIA